MTDKTIPGIEHFGPPPTLAVKDVAAPVTHFPAPALPNWREVLGLPRSYVDMAAAREAYQSKRAAAAPEEKHLLDAALAAASMMLLNTTRFHAQDREEEPGGTVWWLVYDHFSLDFMFDTPLIVAVCRREAQAKAIAKLLNWFTANPMVSEELGISLKDLR